MDCLIKKLGTDIDNLLSNSTHLRHLLKRKTWTSIVLFCIHLEFQPKMKNWIMKTSTNQDPLLDTIGLKVLTTISHSVLKDKLKELISELVQKERMANDGTNTLY